MKNRKYVCLAGLYAALLAGVLLIGAGPALAAPTESAVLATLVNKAAQPSLKQASTAAQSLAQAVRQLCRQRDDASLKQARQAWRKAYLAWRKASPFYFGPAQGLGKSLGLPINEVVLKAAVTSSEFGDMLQKKDLRGFYAAEYLLFVPKDAAGATGAGRCAHLADITGEIAAKLNQAQQAWAGAYGRELMTAGNGKPFLLPGDALSIFVANAVNLTEVVLRDQISIPSGYFEGASKPEYLSAWRSNSAKESFQAVVEGLRMVVEGGQDSLAELVATKDGLVSKKDPELAKAMRKQLAEVEDAVDDLDGDGLYDELKDDPDELRDVYDRLQALQDQIIEASLVLELDVRTPEENMVN